MADLFSNEYFNRAWVIQEVAVGQKPELYIAGTYIPWMVFASYVSLPTAGFGLVVPFIFLLHYSALFSSPKANPLLPQGC